MKQAFEGLLLLSGLLLTLWVVGELWAQYKTDRSEND